jgi:hypothetical protein
MGAKPTQLDELQVHLPPPICGIIDGYAHQDRRLEIIHACATYDAIVILSRSFIEDAIWQYPAGASAYRNYLCRQINDLCECTDIKEDDFRWLTGLNEWEWFAWKWGPASIIMTQRVKDTFTALERDAIKHNGVFAALAQWGCHRQS